MRIFWTKVTSAGGLTCSFVICLAAQRWLVRVILANSLAGSALAFLLLALSTKAPGATMGASRMMMLVRNNNKDGILLLSNNVSLC